MKVTNVAIDGPAGAGKSTIAKAVSKKLGYIYIDTGALYRTVGLNALRLGVDIQNDEEVASTLTDELSVELKFVDGEQRMFLNGEDVSLAIRSPEASMAASRVSAVPAVRKYLFDLQKNLAKSNNCIMDGRDIGTVILPDAQLKVFLTATAEERAMRRTNELIEKGQNADYEQVLADIKERDDRDSNRAIAPLKPADDAIMFNNTGFTPEQSLAKLLEIVKDKLGISEVQYEK